MFVVVCGCLWLFVVVFVVVCVTFVTFVFVSLYSIVFGSILWVTDPVSD